MPLIIYKPQGVSPAPIPLATQFHKYVYGLVLENKEWRKFDRESIGCEINTDSSALLLFDYSKGDWWSPFYKEDEFGWIYVVYDGGHLDALSSTSFKELKELLDTLSTTGIKNLLDFLNERQKKGLAYVFNGNVKLSDDAGWTLDNGVYKSAGYKAPAVVSQPVYKKPVEKHVLLRNAVVQAVSVGHGRYFNTECLAYFDYVPKELEKFISPLDFIYKLQGTPCPRLEDIKTILNATAFSIDMVIHRYDSLDPNLLTTRHIVL